MRTEFVHLADVHLGTEQYGSGHRYNDFALAFQSVARHAIERRVQFVVISGDLFNKHNLDPMTLNQAVMVLQELRQAGIPVVAIEGNHDRSHYKSFMSWLQFLSDQGLLILLDLVPEGGRQRLLPWNASDARGSYVDMDGVRICGMRYFGAATARLLAEVATELETVPGGHAKYTVFMMHVGMEGYIPHMSGGLTPPQIEPLRERVNYLALGHIHKKYDLLDWVYNPGSIETWRADEAQWPRGFFHVTVDTDAQPLHHVELVKNPRRPFHTVWLDVGACSSPHALSQAACRAVEEEMPRVREQQDEAKRAGLDDVRPVVHLFLKGILPFDRQSLELDELQRLVQDASGALLAQVKDGTRPTGYEVQSSATDRLDRAELEVSVFRQLLERDARYRPAAEDWARLAARVKELALEGAPPEAIVETVSQHQADHRAAPDVE